MDYIQAANYCLDLVQNYLKLFIEKILIEKYSQNYLYYMCNGTNSNVIDSFQQLPTYQDALFYLNALQKNWSVLSSYLPSKAGLNLSYSLRNYRNQIAHQAPISLRHFYRFVDETELLLEELNASKADLDQLDVIRKNLIIQMAQCNDNIIVMSKKPYNSFNDLNAEMKSEENNHCSNENSIQLGKTKEEKIIDHNYEKIVSNSNSDDYFSYSYFDNDN